MAFELSKGLTKCDFTNDEPLRGAVRIDFSAGLEMTSGVLLKCVKLP